MSIAEYIKPECILLNLDLVSRDEVFETLASCFYRGGLMSEETSRLLVKKLEEREKLSTTGVGEGIAIPHASLDGFKETAIAVGVIPKGVDFHSVDGRPVKIVFMIVGSQAVPRLHIQILARIVRLSRNKELMKKIQEGTSQKEVLDAIRMVDT